MQIRIQLILFSVVLSFSGCGMIETVFGDIETPAYQVVESHGNIEIRRYEPMIIAEVQLPANAVKPSVTAFA